MGVTVDEPQRAGHSPPGPRHQASSSQRQDRGPKPRQPSPKHPAPPARHADPGLELAEHHTSGQLSRTSCRNRPHLRTPTACKITRHPGTLWALPSTSLSEPDTLHQDRGTRPRARHTRPRQLNPRHQSSCSPPNAQRPALAERHTSDQPSRTSCRNRPHLRTPPACKITRYPGTLWAEWWEREGGGSLLSPVFRVANTFYLTLRKEVCSADFC